MTEQAAKPQEQGVVVLDKAILGATGFALKIGKIAIENEVSYNDLFNGINMSASSFLLEMCIKPDGTVDKEHLNTVTEKFIEGFRQTIAFAAENVNADKVEFILPN